MTAAEVAAAALNQTGKRFARVEAAYEAYPRSWIQCEYDSNGRVVFVEITAPGSATIGAYEAIGLGGAAAKDLLHIMGLSIRAEDGASILGGGLVLGADEDSVMSAAAFTHEYGEELRGLFR